VSWFGRFNRFFKGFYNPSLEAAPPHSPYKTLTIDLGTHKLKHVFCSYDDKPYEQDLRKAFEATLAEMVKRGQVDVIDDRTYRLVRGVEVRNALR
jgi:hypothetical protein